jgi:ribosome silencing factor RsfS/YbeB/iojap
MPHRPARSGPPVQHRNPEYDIIARKPPTPPAPPKDPPGTAKKAAVPRKRASPRKPTGPALPAPPGTPRKKAVAAGPSRGRVRPLEAAEVSRLDQLQKVIVTSLEDDKAENIVTIELAGRAAFADRMVVATGLADRQIAAMATHLEDKLEEAGLKRVQIEGASGSDWVLIDAGDIVVHLFKPEARTMYGLERMWGAELDEESVAPG